jgi:hypothetical protein
MALRFLRLEGAMPVIFARYGAVTSEQGDASMVLREIPTDD